MSDKLKAGNLALTCAILLLYFLPASGQGTFDNASRATYIFDISQYVNYGESYKDTSVFRIGIVDDTIDLFFELGRLRNQRPVIQGKPVHIMRFRTEEAIKYTEVLYVNQARGYKIDKVKNMIRGKKTLLLTEGYPFRESMINFVRSPEGKMKFEANEEMITAAGLSVNPILLFQAVKTREEWEDLFVEASEQIEVQKAQIAAQMKLLDSLDKVIAIKEADIADKEKLLTQQLAQLSEQVAQINRQKGQISIQKRDITDQIAVITKQQAEMKLQKDTLSLQKENIAEQIKRITMQLQQIGLQDKVIKVQLEAIAKQKMLMWFFIIALVLVGVIAYYIYRSYRIKKEANRKLEEKNVTILKQRDEMEIQRDQIAYQKKHITDSILYAKRIQTALLPSIELFSDRVEHFVLYKPLDIVSGDFYWVTSKGDIQVVIVADCTGHGVPGAFMSMLGVTMLNELINVKEILEADTIINTLRNEVIKALKQSVEDDKVKDGLDMAVCVLDFSTNTLQFSGANSPLILVRGSELIQYRGDKMPVSIHYNMNPFTRHLINLQKGDCFYMFTDGFCDQFGGPDQKKFMSARLKEKLVEVSKLPMIQQGETLNAIFEEWRGDNPQVDDVAMVGIRY